jgi:arylsulfatase
MLAEKKLAENTIFIYLTDNGGTQGVQLYNAGMRGKKIDLYDGGHRVPCFVHWPAGKLGKPRDIGELTICQDLLPTLLDLCNVLQSNAKRDFDGVSLAALLRGERAKLDERMSVIQFSRMNAPQPKPGDATVLWNRLRLVNNEELYDIGSDPGQERDLAASRPDDVARMRAHYEAWWKRIEPTVKEHEYIVVESDAENPSRLSAADWSDVFLDQQAQIRAGIKANGPWNVEFAAAGEYEFIVSRWPLEAKLPITAAAPPHEGEIGSYPAGIAIPAVAVRLKVGDFEEVKSITADDFSMRFVTKVGAGRTQVQTWLRDAEGRDGHGAYYVQVRRL